jgi:hypothetical protein
MKRDFQFVALAISLLLASSQRSWTFLQAQSVLKTPEQRFSKESGAARSRWIRATFKDIHS